MNFTTNAQTVLEGLPNNNIALSLVDAARARRLDDARFYSNNLLLSVPDLSKEVVDAIYWLGRAK